MSCIRPRAPLLDTAQRLKFDSVFMTARTKAGSTPLFAEIVSTKVRNEAGTSSAERLDWESVCALGTVLSTRFVNTIFPSGFMKAWILSSAFAGFEYILTARA